ncbi:hypothetical protein [Streptomyces spiralis]|uniref:hypothetical protein n=1 Tax=Streptomyces spiralis TaxID=66376 RepID=UPI00340E7A03
MPESRSGRAHIAEPVQAPDPAIPEWRQRRPVTLLADMVAGARTIRVSQREPDGTRPSPYARAYEAQGSVVTLNRAQGMTAARWVIRTYPEVVWSVAHDHDLATGVLRPTAGAYTVTDRRR